MKFGPICVGIRKSVSDMLAEDYLFINIWKLTNASFNSNLPMWLFIQGGGYAHNMNANYNSSKVVERSGHNILFINFNYHIGVLGFLASEEMWENSDLNASLLNQHKVLTWMQKYIHSFGGNPDHVMIHGDSAGASSVSHHLTVYSSCDSNLFVSAVAESTFWLIQHTVAEMVFQYECFVQDVGCDILADEVWVPLTCRRASAEDVAHCLIKSLQRLLTS